MHAPRRLVLVRILLFCLAAVLARSASAQYCWTSAGGNATVDTGDVSKALLNAHLSVIGTAPLPAVVTARYSITGIHDFKVTQQPVKRSVVVRSRDNGLEARVQVSILQHSLGTGTNTPVLTLDSNDVSPSSDFKSWGNESDCSVNNAFDTLNNLYLLRVDLTKSGAGGSPSLQMVSVCLIPC